ncbi:MAG: sigma-70 family RNA polymerase sigma factor [Ruminococcus sp.]
MNRLLSLSSISERFCNTNISELAVAAKNSKSAAAVLISRFSRLIETKAAIFADSASERDDLAQEGIMGLLSAVNSFDPMRGVKFSTFAEICVVNRMKTFVARRMRCTGNLDDGGDIESVSDYETPESICLYREYFSELMDNIGSVLSDSENRVFSLFLEGLSYRSIAERLGISEKSVDNAMQRARRKIRMLIQQ